MRAIGKVVELELKDLKNKSNVGTPVVLSKKDIKRCILNKELIIDPLNEDLLGPCDINLRISENYARIKNIQQPLDLGEVGSESINGKYFRIQPNEHLLRKYFSFQKDKKYIIQPNEHLLIESIEYLKMPKYLTALIALRSTFSRLGLSTPPTLIDPGFKGKIVFHLIGSSYPIWLYEGIAVFKVIFMYTPTNIEAYSGKYQDQYGIILPKGDPIWRKKR